MQDVPSDTAAARRHERDCPHKAWTYIYAACRPVRADAEVAYTLRVGQKAVSLPPDRHWYPEALSLGRPRSTPLGPCGAHYVHGRQTPHYRPFLRVVSPHDRPQPPACLASRRPAAGEGMILNFLLALVGLAVRNLRMASPTRRSAARSSAPGGWGGSWPCKTFDQVAGRTESVTGMNELSRAGAAPWAGSGSVFSQAGLAPPVAWAAPHDLDRLRASHSARKPSCARACSASSAPNPPRAGLPGSPPGTMGSSAPTFS